ncbi:molybdopterin molybdotransferase MoeA [Alteriqipengyuania flavescens]|uniref:molybdopterin molybdotransferase MoeA n=1 Tax=Alteriqipengyuania flavescens TaxID=3053610 RepID=UPI0025B4F881|nr:gephyrin-like molybdotransferase Glp [Alteriqipengyuania flavescens]WJY17817.1 molybdopterin molybdotransferase MoeA [Alteriqipengyuania flavescens]WJY23759.1 molybdopterin molybdotransferase MoeA [Alteriqipengyuania flavescens]
MISFDEATERLQALARPLGPEPVALANAHGRVLAEPVLAMVDAPPADVSSMDGYAVREADLAALPVTLPVAFENAAGVADAGSLPESACARIFTGAPLPAGADRVVMQEEVERSGDAATFAAPHSSARFVRKRGSDFSRGDALLPAGTVLGPRQLVAAAAADHAQVTCWRRPRVALLSTGDELAEPGKARATPGAIPESLSAGLGAFVNEWGGLPSPAERLGDDLPTLESAAARAVADHDLVVVTGGASVGERDFAKAMFDPLGLDLAFGKVAIKPGKPVWLGRVGVTSILGLPGNPTSAMVTARLFLAPLLAGMNGRPFAAARNWGSHVLAAPLPPCGSRETFVRAKLDAEGNARPLGNQDSGLQHALASADLLIRRAAAAPALAVGANVPTLTF